MLDKCQCHGLIVFAIEVIILQEIVKVQHSHVGSLSQSSSECGLARAFGTNIEEDLWHHGLFGVRIHLIDTPVSIDEVDLREFFV